MRIKTSSARQILLPCFFIIIIGVVVVSCISKSPTVQPQRIETTLNGIPTDVPLLTQSEIMPSQSVTESLDTPHKTSTISPIETGSVDAPFSTDSGEIDLRITFQTVKVGDANELIASYLWVLSYPYQHPRLLHVIDKGNQNHIVSPVYWSHAGDRLAFVHLVADESHIAVSILDMKTDELVQFTESISCEDPYATSYIIRWSIDDRWIYLNMDDGFIHSRIIDTSTKDRYQMNQLTQDELVAWSPVEVDEYAYISRKNYPEPGRDMICIGKVNQTTPEKCVESPEGQVILSPYTFRGNTFSWSLDGEYALVASMANDPLIHYMLLDFRNDLWSNVLVDKQYLLSNDWSPDSQWVVLFEYRKGLRLLSPIAETAQLIEVSNSQNPLPLGWILEGNLIVYQDEYAVYYFSPDGPEKPILIYDFESVLSETAIYQIDLVFGDTPITLKDENH